MLAKNYWGNNESWLTIKYLSSSFHQESLSYVAKDGIETIGGIIMVYEDIVKNWIRLLIVDKKYQRSGIGSRLLRKVIKNMKKDESLFLDTGTENKGAIKFYKKHGFKLKGKIAELYNDKSAYIFKKKL